MGNRFVWDVARFLGASAPVRKASLPEASSGTAERLLVEIPLRFVRPNPNQPRQHFDEDELEELAQSIRSLGLIQPIVVRRRDEETFELIAGERRLRACERAGLESIAAVVMEVDETTRQIMALVENLQRRDLSAVEEARSFNAIMERTGWSQIELARRLGRSQAAVANKLRLLQLPETVLDLVVAGKLSERHARALLPLPEGLRIDLARKTVEGGLRVRELEKLAAAALKPSAKPALKGPPSSPSGTADPPPSFLAGDDAFLRALAHLVERVRASGTAVHWKVREEGQRERVVEIRIALNHPGSEADERS